MRWRREQHSNDADRRDICGHYGQWEGAFGRPYEMLARVKLYNAGANDYGTLDDYSFIILTDDAAPAAM